jgi:hypothetical protein
LNESDIIAVLANNSAGCNGQHGLGPVAQAPGRGFFFAASANYPDQRFTLRIGD